MIKIVITCKKCLTTLHKKIRCDICWNTYENRPMHTEKKTGVNLLNTLMHAKCIIPWKTNEMDFSHCRHRRIL